MYVHKRPFMKEFLAKLAELGTVSVFVGSKRNYADPIINAIDPDHKYFKYRFYNDSCVNTGDGQILKDMSVIENIITNKGNLTYSDSQQTGDAGANAVEPNFFTRVKRVLNLEQQAPHQHVVHTVAGTN